MKKHHKSTEIFSIFVTKKKNLRDFAGGTVGKNPPANAGDTGLIPGPERRGATTSDAHMPRVCAPQQEEPQLAMPTRRVCAPQQEEPQLVMPTHLESVLPNRRSHN